MVTVTSRDDRLVLSRAEGGQIQAMLIREHEPIQELRFDLKEALSGQGKVRFVFAEPTEFLRVVTGDAGQRPEFSGFIRKVDLDELRS